jgi:hypothetical protein
MRRVGEMMKVTDRATGAAGIGPIAVPEKYCNQPPTLAEIGLTKKESVLAQKLAERVSNCVIPILGEHPSTQKQYRIGASGTSKLLPSGHVCKKRIFGGVVFHMNGNMHCGASN